MRTYSQDGVQPRTMRAAQQGFSLVELMVAMVLGLVLTGVMINVYLSSSSSVRRQEQLNSLQQNVRTAFEYLSSDARMIGHQGCFTGSTKALNTNLGAPTLTTNYAFGVEGYDYVLASAGALTLGGLSPTDTATVANWSANGAVGSITPIDPHLVSSGSTTGGLTPGSDVLVIRTVGGNPMRLTAATTVAAPTIIALENVAGGTCHDGTTSKVSGFCANSHGLIASCANARVFQVQSIAGSTLTINSSLGADIPYPVTGTEVFPLQTVVYFVRLSSTGSGTSLYRRIFDGDFATGQEQELIDGVETMQVTYGEDTDVTADGAVNSYVTANNVQKWDRVVAVRMSLLLRSADPISDDLSPTLPTTARVNGVTVTFPSGSGVRHFDRRVFTTTVAVRNKISYGL